MGYIVRVLGERETQQLLERLEPKVARRILAKAVRAQARPFVKRARALAPKRNRVFSRSLDLVIRRYGGTVFAAIGQDKAKVVRVKRIKHAGGISGRGDVVPIHLVDQPTKPHKITPRKARQIAAIAEGRRGVLKINVGGATRYAAAVSHPGTRGAQFMRAAFDSSKEEGVRAFADKFGPELEREAGSR